MRLPSLLALTGFALLLAGALLWRFLPSIDLRLFDLVRLDARSAWAGPARIFTDLGGFAVLGPLGLAITAWLLAQRRFAGALWLFATIGSGRLAVEGIKALVGRPRPPLAERLAEVTTHSFPSSHTAGTLLTWLALAMLFLSLRRGLLPFAMMMAVAIGWSRIALGVHWPSDVIAGYGLAMLWIGVAARWLPQRPLTPV